MTLKQFSTAGKQRVAAEIGDGKRLPDISFVLDDVTFQARGPKDTQLAVLVASTVETKTDAERVAALLDFFEQVLEQPGRGIMRRRMLDTNDPLDLDNVIEIFDHLVAEWGGSPSTSASA